MTTPHKQQTAFAHVPQESILVVKRDVLFPHGPWNGIRTGNFTYYLNIVKKNKEFLPRNEMEQDPSYKQIIPYIVFKHEGKLFVMQRKETASETRLQSKYSLGIGGHIRKEDMTSGDIFDWANREFHEEVSYDDAMTIEPLGVLNDDSNDVGKVHIGFVFLVHGNTPDISIKSELKSGTLIPLEECMSIMPLFETWSQTVLETLLTRRSV